MSSLRVEIGRKSEYNNLMYTVSDTLYYCIDTNEVFRGDKKTNDIVRIVAAESPSPYQGVLYVLYGTVKSFNGTAYETLGEAYRIGTSKLYTLDMALEDAAVTTDSSTSVANIEDNGSDIEDKIAQYKANALTESEYSSEITQVDDTADIESISEGVLSTFSTTAVSNIRAWDEVETNEITVNNVDELDAIDKSTLATDIVAVIPDDDGIITKYVWDGTEWVLLGQSSSLESYYEDVDYVATPLTSNTFDLNTDLLSVSKIEEIEAMDFVMFAAVSGASARGVVSAPSAMAELDDDTATTGYVASVIAAATQNVLSYVDGLSQLYDPLGAADRALERAKAYTDERLRWHRLA